MENPTLDGVWTSADNNAGEDVELWVQDDLEFFPDSSWSSRWELNAWHRGYE